MLIIDDLISIYLDDGRGEGGGKECLSSKSRSLAARPSSDEAKDPLGLDPLKCD